MDLQETLNSLLSEGQRLLLFGGNIFDGYNGEHQSEYVAWRVQVIAILGEMGPTSRTLIQEIEADEHGRYLMSSSVQGILGVLQGALAIADRQKSKEAATISRWSSSELNIVWGPLRAILENNFTFGIIKEISGLAGIDLTNLSHLQQAAGSSTSKGQLMTVLDGLLGAMLEGEKRRFITITTEEVLKRQPQAGDALKDYLSRLGWTIYGGKIIPLEILDIADLAELPEEARPDLAKASQRLRDGDLSGALAAACGAVDATTSTIYKQRSLGDPGSASFQERVLTCLKADDAFARLEADLQLLGWDVKETKPFRENLTKAFNHAAYVMQSLRSNMGDVHGSKPILKPLVFDSIKWALLIIRVLA